MVQPWKVAEEIIGVSVPIKARSGRDTEDFPFLVSVWFLSIFFVFLSLAFAKRLQECWVSGGSNSRQMISRQASMCRQEQARPLRWRLLRSRHLSSNASVQKKMVCHFLSWKRWYLLKRKMTMFEGGEFWSFKKNRGPNVAGDWLISPEGPNWKFLQKLSPQLKAFLNRVLICNYAIS